MDTIGKVAQWTPLGMLGKKMFDSGGSTGKGKAVKKAVGAERENAARAAQKSAEMSTPSLMTPLADQSRTNSINGMGKVGKY